MNTDLEYMVVSESKLNGITIPISGYRHSSNLLMSAAILMPEADFTFTNIPDLLDTDIMIAMLKELGASCWYKDGVIKLNTRELQLSLVSEELSKQIHGSIYLIPTLLARFGKVSFGESGGCQIGSTKDQFRRPADHIYAIMKKFGAEVFINENGYVTAEAQNLNGIQVDINEFSYERNALVGPLTSGATKTAILMALAVKKGITIIHNPFLKSETIDLLDFIQECGYVVTLSPQKLTIEYQKRNSHVLHHVISDPSEIITYSCLAGYHDIELQFTNITLRKTWEILKPEIQLLERMGLAFQLENNMVTVKKITDIQSQDVKITPNYICTDHHPFILTLLLKAHSKSSIEEFVWLERFQYIPELNKFGIQVEQNKNRVTIFPGSPTYANDIIVCPDLRAAAMLLIVALSAPGETILSNFHHLRRGYVRLIDNLKKMGANIRLTRKTHEAVTN